MLEALKAQVGGDHYKSMKIQPAEYILANGIGHYEAAAIEYISRWKMKGGVASLEKAQQCLQILIDYRRQQNVKPTEPDDGEQRRLIEWIERKGGSVTAREVQQGHRRYKTAQDAEAALEELAAGGLGYWESSPTGQRGHPTRRFRLDNGHQATVEAARKAQQEAKYNAASK